MPPLRGGAPRTAAPGASVQGLAILYGAMAVLLVVARRRRRVGTPAAGRGRGGRFFVVATSWNWWRFARGCARGRRENGETGVARSDGNGDRKEARERYGRDVEALCGDLSAIRAPRGTALNALSWQTEAPLRMLLNNLDPEVAEHPEKLVVYGGSGRAARSHDALRAIVRTLLRLATTRRCSCNRASRSACSGRMPARLVC